MLYCANYNYSPRLAGQVSEKGPGKLFAKSFDLPIRTACRHAGREGLLFWTMITVTGNYTYPEHTPDGVLGVVLHLASHSQRSTHDGGEYLQSQTLLALCGLRSP